MEQYNKIVLEAPQGMHYTTSKGENGELIVRLVHNFLETSQEDSTICSQCEAVEKSENKAIHFTKITAEDREKVKQWLTTKQRNAPKWAKEFLDRVQESLQVIDYDYWIANLEPSVKDGKIYYAKNEDVGVGYTSNEWKEMAKEYATERGSRLAKLSELIMWYALRIANGLWPFKYVAYNSSSVGNYINAPGSSRKMEKTGTRKCGGYEDGQGNSYKIVTAEDEFAFVGGNFSCCGHDYQISFVYYCRDPYFIHCKGSGVLVLTK